jgi:hypothetical protein
MADDRVQVEITADSSEIEAGTARASSAVEGFAARAKAAAVEATEAFEGLETAIGAIGDIALAGAAFEGVNKVREFVEEISKSTIEVGHLAEAVGVPIESFAALTSVFAIADVSAANVGRAMRVLETRAAQAGEGSRTAADDFGRFGISVASLKGVTPEDLFLKVADAASQMSASVDKSAAVAELFGSKIGTSLIPVLDLGAGEIRSLMDAFNTLDPVTQRNVESAENLHKAWLALTAAATGGARSFTSLADDALTAVDNSLLRLGSDAKSTATFLEELWSKGPTQAAKDAQDVGTAYMKAVEAIATAGVKVQGASSAAGSPGDSFATTDQRKKAFQDEGENYVSSQELILAAAGQTADARMTYESDVLNFLKSHIRKPQASKLI